MLLYEAVQNNLILFTSTGLWGLTLNNRYTHAVMRFREFYDKQCDENELAIMMDRCFALKWSFMCLIFSVLVGILHAIVSAFNAHELISPILVGGYCLFLFASMCFLMYDVFISFNATLIHANYRKG